MTIKFHPNRSFAAEMAKAAKTQAALEEIAGGVAERAEANASEISDTYQATVTKIDGKVAVAADTHSHDGVDAAAYIEFGTGEPGPTPAYAPLRKAVQSEGLELK